MTRNGRTMNYSYYSFRWNSLYVVSGGRGRGQKLPILDSKKIIKRREGVKNRPLHTLWTAPIPKTDKSISKLANSLFVIWYKESLKYKPGTWYIAFLALFLGHWAPLAWRPVAKNKQNCLTSSSMCGWAGEIDEARFSYQNYTLWKEIWGLMNNY